nr:MAG TPA: hypothetical protein [Bacteriophage sp.]
MSEPIDAYVDIVSNFTYKDFRCQINRYYVHNKYEKVPENTMQLSMNPQWLCGYIVIPYNHALYAESTESYFEEARNVNNIAHGGITYADFSDRSDFRFTNLFTDEDGDRAFVIGFDCNHFGDSYLVQDESYVTKNLKQIIDQIIKDFGAAK